MQWRILGWNPGGVSLAGLLIWFLGAASGAQEVLPGTTPLRMEGDIASNLVAGVDRFLLGELERSVLARSRHWRKAFASAQEYEKSLQPNRERLAHILGVRDARGPWEGLERVETTVRPALLARGSGYQVLQVRWKAFADVQGEGLLLEPEGVPAVACVVALPDADQTPEQLVGLSEGLPAAAQWARRLAESGCRVVVPVLISRTLERRRGRANLTHREYLYRSAFELGRHLVGYEVQKVLALVDGWVAERHGLPVGVFGYGEGGSLALYAGALDSRIAAVGVSGYFDSRQRIWEEPIDRNVFGLLDQFGDAELASMVAARHLVVEASLGPELTLPGEGGAPARLVSPSLAGVRAEWARAMDLAGDLGKGGSMVLVESGGGRGGAGSVEALEKFGSGLTGQAGWRLAAAGRPPEMLREAPDSRARERRQLEELDRHSQWLLGESAEVRREFMKNLDTTSLETYARTVEPYRRIFREEVVGWFARERLPFQARTRLVYDEPGWRGYEVVLDVFPEVMAYGILLLPKDIQEGERRPVVVCQHGLEGRPQQVIRGNHDAYHDFAARLAERGFITFAPQNLYLFTDRFRTLQRKANPLGKTLFSVITPQHEQIVDWLQTLPQVDPERIAFYGLSYGGKTAMRVPALVTDYCLSICSADFNEWVWKNASTRSPYSYVWTGEYEIFEFDLGSTFNYAEMAALIAPRPFMVERGHFDGVAPDEAVAYEFAKVRHLYAARLKLPERCEVEWFDGPHTIHGEGTFEFLHRHLRWPARR